MNFFFFMTLFIKYLYSLAWRKIGWKVGAEANPKVHHRATQGQKNSLMNFLQIKTHQTSSKQHDDRWALKQITRCSIIKPVCCPVNIQFYREQVEWSINHDFSAQAFPLSWCIHNTWNRVLCIPDTHVRVAARWIHSHDSSLPFEEEDRLLCDPDVSALYHDGHPLPGLLLAQPGVGAGQNCVRWVTLNFIHTFQWW